MMIKLENISKYYDTTFPIHKCSLTFKEDKSYIISGPSGSGKTTLLRLIMGLDSLDQGRICSDDLVLSSADYTSHPSSRDIGMVFQTPGLWNHMTVKKNITFGLDKKEESSRLKLILEKLQIEHLLHKHPEQLSGGEKKRVALARMLVHKWQVLLLDEPLAHVEKVLKLKIIDYIRSYVKENKTTLIYITHDCAEIEALQGHVIYVTELGFNDDVVIGDVL